PGRGYRSAFSHEDEFAEPGYYRVLLKDDHILAELTVTPRCGFHRYTFPSDQSGHVILDLEHGIADTPVETYIKIVDSVTVAGYRRSSGWAMNHTIYFYARFSKPFSDWNLAEGQQEIEEKSEYKGKKSKIVLSFGLTDQIPLLIKVGISPVDIEGARKNLEAELPDWDFDRVRRQAKEKWNQILSRIHIKASDPEAKIKFYTSLYHALIHPSLFSDVDGRYVGMDGKIHQSEEPYYTIFSLWDTFRATHPFWQFVYPEYNEAFVRTMLKKYRKFGQLPMWELHSNETYCMTGNHSLPVLAEYIRFGNPDEKTRDLIAEAAIRTSFLNERDMDDYRRYGFIPSDAGSDAVTKTLEYAYDDYCVAKILEEALDYTTAEYFRNRSFSYTHLFDSTTGFFRGKNRTGLWVSPFDPVRPSGWGTSDYTEGNAWQYLWFVP
ncbi:MAG: glycoside hydrolase family 92 protein, partial [Methanobacteriota archaeon]